MSDSILYTIGTALNRAKDNDVQVQVLVGGEWLGGYVAAVDGHGLVLTTDDHDHSVIRIESVTAVRILADLPDRTPITAGAHVMPGAASNGY